MHAYSLDHVIVCKPAFSVVSKLRAIYQFILRNVALPGLSLTEKDHLFQTSSNGGNTMSSLASLSHSH